MNQYGQLQAVGEQTLQQVTFLLLSILGSLDFLYFHLCCIFLLIFLPPPQLHLKKISISSLTVFLHYCVLLNGSLPVMAYSLSNLNLS